LEAELLRAPRRAAPAAPAPAAGPVERARPRRSAGWSLPPMGSERAVLQVLARDRERRHERLEALLLHVGPEDFTDPVWRRIFQAFLDDAELDRAPAGMDPEAVRRLELLLDDRDELLHADRVFGDALAQLRLAALERRGRELDRRMSAASDEAEKQALAAEKAKVAREGREIGLGWSHTARRLAGP